MDGYTVGEVAHLARISDPRFTAAYDDIEPGFSQYVHDAMYAERRARPGPEPGRVRLTRGIACGSTTISSRVVTI